MLRAFLREEPLDLNARGTAGGKRHFPTLEQREEKPRLARRHRFGDLLEAQPPDVIRTLEQREQRNRERDLVPAACPIGQEVKDARPHPGKTLLHVRVRGKRQECCQREIPFVRVRGVSVRREQRGSVCRDRDLDLVWAG